MTILAINSLIFKDENYIFQAQINKKADKFISVLVMFAQLAEEF